MLSHRAKFASALIAALALALSTGAFAAHVPVGADFRISNVGSDGDKERAAYEPAIAYNSQANNYLVVWKGDGSTGDDEFEIFGQLMAANGTEIGSDFQISNANSLNMATNREAFNPAVTYNSQANQYLVSWTADGLATDNDFEIFGQRLSATGEEIGIDFQISAVEPATTSRAAFNPAIAYNSRANQYLVSWSADGLPLANDEFEIFGQLLAADGAKVESNFQISQSNAGGKTEGDAFEPAIAYNPEADEYLVSWWGDGLATNDEFEIFGQRLNGAGAELGGDFRISTTDAGGKTERDAFEPAIAYNSQADEYLVSWTADGLATDDEFEIFGQRLSGSGAEQGGDFRISTTGSDGDKARETYEPAIAYNPRANEYLVSWTADGLATNDEFEIFGQRLNAAGAKQGSELPDLDHRQPTATQRAKPMTPSSPTTPRPTSTS